MVDRNCKQLKKKLQRKQICTTVKSLEKKYLNKESDVVDNIMTVIQTNDLQQAKRQQKQEQTKAITKAPEFKQLQPNVKQKLEAKQKSDETILQKIIKYLPLGVGTMSQENKQILKKAFKSNPGLLNQDQAIELFKDDFSNNYINDLRSKKAQERKKAKAKQQAQAKQKKEKEQAQANELKERKKKIYQIFEQQSTVRGEQISLLDDYFKSLTEIQKKNKDVIIRFYKTYDYLEKPFYLQKIVKQLETQKREKEQQQKKLEQEQANKRLIEAQRIKKLKQQAELKKIQEKKEQMQVKKEIYIGILEKTNNINGLIELLNNNEYSIIQKEIDKKLDEMLKSPKEEMIRLIKKNQLPEKYVENKYPNVQKLKIFHNELKLIKDGKYKPSQNDEILTKYYNDIEKMKKQKKSYTTNKNVKEKKKEKQKDTPEKVKYEGIDMTHNFKYQRQKMKTILNHMNIIQSKTLQESTDIGLNTMKTRINQNLSKLETEIFNNREFDANKEKYKKFYTKKLQQIQTQIQKRQKRKLQKKQQQLQIQKRKQNQKKQQQLRIQILKNKKVQNMTEEQKTQMKELFKDRTLVEGFGSKFLELYKDIDKNNKPPFVKQIQEQLNDIEKKIKQGKQLSQNQKQFLNKYKKQQQLKQQQFLEKDKKTTNLGFVPGEETIYSEPTTSKQTNLTQQDQQRIKSFQNRQDRLEKIKASYDKAMNLS